MAPCKQNTYGHFPVWIALDRDRQSSLRRLDILLSGAPEFPTCLSPASSTPCRKSLYHHSQLVLGLFGYDVLRVDLGDSLPLWAWKEGKLYTSR